MISIIRGRKIFTHLQSDGRWGEVADGAILQVDGVVADIGPYRAIRESQPDAAVIGSDRHVVLPGLVNGHHHVGLTPLQLGSPDLPLELWLVDRLKARSVDAYLDTAYSAFEMVASGVTTVQHIRAGAIGTIADSEKAAHAIIRAYRDIGMRVSLSFSARDQNRLLHQDDEAFTATLPPDLQPTARWHFARFAATIDEYLSLFRTLRGVYAEDGRVAIQLAPANLHWCSDDTLAKFAELSRSEGVPLHMHLLETPLQQVYGKRRGGTSAFDHIARLGLAGPRLTLGHGVWVTEEDIGRIAETGTQVCHNCSSNLRLRSGLAPVNRFIARGINVGIGMDEAGINDDRDMLQEMRLVLNAHRAPGLDEREVPTTDQVLHVATAGGAATTPFGTRIGSLEKGKAADLILIDFDKVAFPFLDPDTRVLDAVLHRATPREVDAVMVAGELIFENGSFTRVDRRGLLAELKTHMGRPISPDELRGRAFAAAVLPYVRRYYQGVTLGAQRS